ncbi:hypothetical protein A3D62_02435 [Candidatus Kaiserbacteria bacterium RIFCSPHIGHO2_02_FULL_49_11]|uniref:Sodium/calcium exchanger membrane region domain-containing protein n=1 Tax=Candidatus Kaiserbacteria bacterium RIFCSPHIGHO2_02_FULL_49_11 TaxID=1798489 RepID=A0A1F6D1E9_9BACT|nr:MAG: hypothetical protein A3D62_02435 [Candidatus Kaiserbacteria bacterium RIFCSPHIGHO2_02_FULL_49_11]
MGLTLALFIFGFCILICGARFLVRGAVSVATLLKVSPWFIGVAIVGIGTSIPELSISISAALQGNNVGLGAVIGSNTFNLLVILGLLALLTPIYIERHWRKDIVVNIVVVALATLIVLLPVIGDASFEGLTRGEGGLLFGLFILWLVFLFNRKAIPDDGADYPVLAGFTSFLFIILGFIGVFFGGEWVVDGAEEIAVVFGVPSAIIGLTIVAIGTSLPELTVSLVAFLKKQKGIAVGNLIGSNVFDFLGILGVTALVKPLPIFESVRIDIFATVAAATAVYVLAFFVGKFGILSRREGAALIFAYIAYLLFVFLTM